MSSIALTYSFIIPVYNEEAALPHLFKRMEETLLKLEAYSEVILVDDGSKDSSYKLLYAQSLKDARFKVLKLSRNFGHQNAVTAGIDAAKGNAVIIMDADLQDPPEVVFDLIAQWKTGYDIVHAVRQNRAGETWFKLATANLFYKFLDHITETKIIRNSGDFRLLDRKVVDVFKTLRENHRFLRGLAGWVGFKQSCVFYQREARVAGETKYPLKRMLHLAINAVTSFSDWPLRLTFKLGCVLSFLAFSVLIYVLVDKLLGAPMAPGWASVMVLMAILNGMLMMMIGTVGIYVGRIFQELKGRPLYIIDDSPSAISMQNPD